MQKETLPDTRLPLQGEGGRCVLSEMCRQQSRGAQSSAKDAAKIRGKQEETAEGEVEASKKPEKTSTK